MKSIGGFMSLSGLVMLVSLAGAADSKPGTDPFFNQQWHFKNVGQKYQKDLDDTRNFTVTGLPGADVSLAKMTLPLKLKRQVIVAVLDSGIDVGHEELKPLLLLNDKECKEGKVPTANTGDLDKNGLDGDCLGWNFTSTRFARLVQDDVGHGTHVSGLIASVAGNGIGVGGYSNDIRILPLKVYDDKEEGGAAAAATRRTNISDRVADALDYAVKRGAEVVNLSMGWPLVSHTEKVKAALDRTIKSGVIVVAGAGNDSHGSPIYPCAHAGVLCVGAMDGDGRVSGFSNLAGHVDIFGPGDQLLSTWPMAMTSDLFGIRGYEYRSGTSQASPLVAGAVAVLKGLFPEESSQAILGRLLSSVRQDLPLRIESGAPLTGLVSLSGAIQNSGQRAVRAFWKGSHLVDVDPKTAAVTLTLNLQNLTAESQEVRTDFAMAGVVGLQSALFRLAPYETRQIGARGRVSNATTQSRSRLQVTVAAARTTEVFEHELRLVGPLSAEAGTAVEFSPALKGLKALSAEELRSVAQLAGPQTAQRFLFSLRTEGEKLMVRLYEVSARGIATLGEIAIDGKPELYGGFPVAALDVDGDGTLEFAVGTVHKKEAKSDPTISISYFGPDMKPLFGDTLSLPVSLESALPTIRNAQMSKFSEGLWAPVVWTQGMMPKADKNPDGFAFEPKAEGALPFAFVPEKGKDGTWSVVPRSLMSFRINKMLRRATKIRTTQSITIVGMMARGMSDARDGKIRILVKTGSGPTVKYWILRGTAAEYLAGTPAVSPFESGGLDFEDQSFDETIVVDQSGAIGRGNQFFGLFTPTVGRIGYLDSRTGGTSIGGVIAVDTQNDREGLLGVIRSYQKGPDAIAFGEGTTQLQVTGKWNGRSVRSKLPIERSSFLPGQLFSQRFAAIVVDQDSKPALFWDNSPLFAPHIGAVVLENSGQLSEPLALSFRKPDQCRVLNPQLEGDRFFLTLQCFENDMKSWKLVVRSFQQ